MYANFQILRIKDWLWNNYSKTKSVVTKSSKKVYKKGLAAEVKSNKGIEFH